jgi:hypothetical protein
MSIEKTNPITAQELTIMPPTAQQPKPFGWIPLLSGSVDAGYVLQQTRILAEVVFIL